METDALGVFLFVGYTHFVILGAVLLGIHLANKSLARKF